MSRKPLNEYRITELMRSIVVLLRRCHHRLKNVVLLKRTKEFVVASASLMHA